MLQRLISATFIVFVVGHLAAFVFLGWMAHHLVFGVRPIPEEARQFTVPPGSSLTQTLDDLHDLGVAPSSSLMRLAIRVFEPDLVIKQGVYEFPDKISPWAILDMLHRGQVALVKLTVREGMDKWETVSFLGSTQWGEEADFLALVNDPAPILSVDPRAPDLEGYLFPETYHFRVDATPKEIVTALVEEFLRQTKSLRDQLDATGMTVRQWVCLASLVEKETAQASERPTISGVFAQRLARGMLLQCDPTIIYALKDLGVYDGNIYRSQILIDHPYNTYVYPGLPPGPIASPGIEALRAAHNPPEHGFLYFVSKNDGTHHFSRNLREHQRAVRRYQRGR